MSSKPPRTTRHPAWEVFGVFLRLGLTSFGGPVAHLGYFRNEFVTRRGWLTERAYADLVALCQFLPGPASSQVGMAIGLLRGGYVGAVAAWLGFTLPSALLLAAFGLGLAQGADGVPAGVLHGLKLVAVAVVAQAVWGMARLFCIRAWQRALAVVAAVVLLLQPAVGMQLAVLGVAGLLGLWIAHTPVAGQHDKTVYPVKPRTGMALLLLFLILLLGLPWAAQVWPQAALEVFGVFYRVGALVFGGGHVVLPLLQAEVVPRGWVSLDTFMAGYGAAQAVPGPLFTFAAFLGAALPGPLGGVTGALLALVAIFLPSFLLVVGALPLWEQLRQSQRVQAALAGINAAVVGLLLAALIQPVATSALTSLADLGVVLLALVALMRWRFPAWAVVLGCGVAGWLLGML